jgi:uncharacterized SAM-binding protein YcdF (DUF218 family)
MKTARNQIFLLIFVIFFSIVVFFVVFLPYYLGMFFWFSKILWFVIAPLNLVFLLMSLGVILFIGFKKGGLRTLGAVWFGAGFVLFAISGLLPVGHNLMVTLENQYSHTQITQDQTTPDIAGIIILGGTINVATSEARNIVTFGNNADRLFIGLNIHRANPQSTLIFSGGDGHLFPTGKSEADLVKLFLKQSHYDLSNVIFETKSRNTFENLKFTKQIIEQDHKDGQWLLITSAYHMPRAMAVAQELDIYEHLTPYPVDYRTTGAFTFHPSLTIARNISLLTIAMREYVGQIAYGLFGKSASSLR